LAELENIMVEEVKVMNEPTEVKINELVRKLNSGVTDVTTFRFVVVTSARKHTSSTVKRQHKDYESSGL